MQKRTKKIKQRQETKLINIYFIKAGSTNANGIL